MMYSSANQQKRPMDFTNSPSQWGSPVNSGNGTGMGDGQPERKKKKKSRWAVESEEEKIVIPGMPTVLPKNLSQDQEKQYLLHLQIEEISRRLRTGDLGIPPNPEDRSPSPEPIYNNEGKRLNTREYRTRKKLEEDRHKLVQEAMSANVEYKPPADYKPPIIRVNDKVMIPQEEHPDINFVGLLIGPRGNTLKNLEKETGAKIIIRGKGSVKDGKIGRKDGQPLPGEDEPLHAYVTANNPENVKKAVAKIGEIIKQGIEVPEGQNDLRRQQLRELALLNGTLRENDGLAKLKQLQQAQTIVTNTIICSLCGGTGHIAQDCKQKRPGDTFRMIQQTTPVDKARMDSEYMSLMAELGEGPPPASKQDTSMLPQPRPIQQPPLQQPFRQQNPFSAPPPNPMQVNPPWQGNMNKPPPGILQMNQRPPMGSQGNPAQPPMQMFPNQQPGMPGMQQPPNQLQQNQGLQALQQLQQSLQQNIQQNLQNLQAQHQQQQQQQQHAPQPVQPPASITSQFQPNMGSQMSAMSSQAPAPVAPPSVYSSTGPMPPPWQTVSTSAVSQFNTTAQSSSVHSPALGVPPPPTMLGAPPPPPPSNQPATSVSNMPWMQAQQNAVPPPPPTSQAQGMWQQQNQGPPPPPGGMPPWQQVPPPPMQGSMPGPGPVAPPPPPPSTGPNYGVAPPPPPPGGFDVNHMSGVNPLLVAPPPPPPN